MDDPKEFLRDIADDVYKLVSSDEIRKRLEEIIEKFCHLVEQSGKSKKLEIKSFKAIVSSSPSADDPLSCFPPRLMWTGKALNLDLSDDQEFMVDVVTCAVIYDGIYPKRKHLISGKADFGGNWTEHCWRNIEHWTETESDYARGMRLRIEAALENVQEKLKAKEKSSQGKDAQGGGEADLPNSIPAKIWAMLCKLYEITLKVIVDAILDRI